MVAVAKLYKNYMQLNKRTTSVVKTKKTKKTKENKSKAREAAM
jgi:hypothetical protein